MPSRDDLAFIRPPSYRAKLSQMIGMSPEEKALFQRIGNLIDVLSFGSRQPMNPGKNTTRARVIDATVPTPQNLVVTGTFGGIVVEWDAIDFSELAFYEVQFDGSSVFSSPETLQSVDTRVVIKQFVEGDIFFVRVRAVSKRGLVSSYTSTQSISSVSIDFLNADQDYIDPENRTAVIPLPELLGSPLDNADGAFIFTGVGACVGPSPLTISDTSAEFSSNIFIRNDITYCLHENISHFPGLENRYLDGLSHDFLEQSTFYSFSPRFYIRPQIYTGSFSDHFDVETILNDPVQIDVDFLRYRIIGIFYNPEHPQTGIVLNASMSTLKF